MKNLILSALLLTLTAGAQAKPQCDIKINGKCVASGGGCFDYSGNGEGKATPCSPKPDLQAQIDALSKRLDALIKLLLIQAKQLVGLLTRSLHLCELTRQHLPLVVCVYRVGDCPSGHYNGSESAPGRSVAEHPADFYASTVKVILKVLGLSSLLFIAICGIGVAFISMRDQDWNIGVAASIVGSVAASGVYFVVKWWLVI